MLEIWFTVPLSVENNFAGMVCTREALSNMFVSSDLAFFKT